MGVELVILACLQGIVIGALGVDYALRRADANEREKLKNELVTAQKALAELHNKNAEAMRALQDKVNAHAMALSSGYKLK